MSKENGASFLDSLGDADLVDNVEYRTKARAVAASVKQRADSSTNGANASKTSLSNAVPSDTDMAFLETDSDAEPILIATKVVNSHARDVDYSESEPMIALSVLNGIQLVASAVSAFAMGSWRGLAYGEQLQDSDEDTKFRASKPERDRVRPIGSKGGTRSEYIVYWNNKTDGGGVSDARRQFEATAGWWLREAHHDPLGADPMMMSMLLIAFSAGMLYSSFLEALLLCLVIEAFEWLTWLIVRASSEIIAKELNACESRGVAMVYNFVVFGVGVALAKFVLYTWNATSDASAHGRHHHHGADGALYSVWDAMLRDKHCARDSGVFLVWLPCTDTVTFITIALLFLCLIFASFRRLYIPSMIMLALLVPTIALAAPDSKRVFNTLLFTVLTSLYFLAFMLHPIRQTYVWNLLIATAFYLLVYCMVTLSSGIF
jgi:hypothetical protein